MNRSRFVSCVVVCIFVLPLYAQMPARQIADKAVSQASADDTVSYIKKALETVTRADDRRSLYAFLGSVQEQLSLFDDARDSYAAAAAIAAGDAAGMPPKSSEQLVLDAVRCALDTGDYRTADSYLNSAVRNSGDETIQAYIRLYAAWSDLCKVPDASALNEPVVILKAYSELPSMAVVKPSVLLTLWYVTGSEDYAGILKKEFPVSPETAVVSGTALMLPSPFWYFVPRLGTVQPDIAVDSISADEKTGQNDSGNQKALCQQLGLFREKGNAMALVQQLKEKGFTASVTSEKRPSGTTYFIVVVSENASGSMGDQLRSAGFECYPVFSGGE